MQVNTYLNFNGQCEEAFRFYEKVFGGKIDAMIPHEGTPAAEHVPAAWLKKIMHAHLVAGNVVLMGSDVPPERYSQPKGFAVALHTKQVSEGERIFHALAEGGNVGMPMQETFWAVKFGMLVDRFGMPWMVNCEKAA